MFVFFLFFTSDNRLEMFILGIKVYNLYKDVVLKIMGVRLRSG
jgi:hypothetical protein